MPTTLWPLPPVAVPCFRKLRYYKRYIQPGGLPRLHLYGVYAATANDGDKELYAALLRSCEGMPHSSSSGANGSSSSGDITDASGEGELASSADSSSRAIEHAAAAAATSGPGHSTQQEVLAALEAAAQRACRLPAQRRAELLLRGDAHAAAEELLGMRVFLGGVSHGEFHAWARRTGFAFGGGAINAAGNRVKVEL